MTYAELMRKYATDATNEGGMWFSGECMSSLAAIAESLESENSKLRELLLDTLTTISWCTIDCCPSDNKKRELNLRACELGIELNDYE